MAIVVASNAQARLTIAMEVKAANKRQPGLNASTGYSDGFDMTWVILVDGCKPID
jgi:hypothetical protein